MDNRSIIGLGAVTLVVVIGLAFYWYEYRPSRIRAACETRATEQAAESFRQLTGKQAPKGLYSQVNKEAYYLSCVREHGLER